VPHISDVNYNLDQMLHITTSLSNQLTNILHNFVCLSNRVMAGQIHCIVKILWTLTSQPNGFASRCDYGLAKIVVELLWTMLIPLCVDENSADFFATLKSLKNIHIRNWIFKKN
jgi:hypothetical protein